MPLAGASDVPSPVEGVGRAVSCHIGQSLPIAQPDREARRTPYDGDAIQQTFDNHGRPRTSERAEDRERLVRSLSENGILDPRTLQAIRDVPRHWFVPAHLADRAYDDDALPLELQQTISQPYVVGLMTELLGLREDDKVLEIGTGSGYQAAVLSEVTSSVFTVDVRPELAERARATFEAHGYRTINVRIADGWAGWAEEAPFDAILVAAAPEFVPPELLDQLKPGRRMCIPVGPYPTDQTLLLVRKGADSSIAIERITPVRFVRMRSEGDPRE